MHAFLWTPQLGMKNLNSVVPLSAVSALISAVCITDSGHIADSGSVPASKKVTGGENVFLLTPQ